MKKLFESKNLPIYEVVIAAPEPPAEGEEGQGLADYSILYATSSADLVMAEAKKEVAKHKGGYLRTIHKIGDLFSVLLDETESHQRRELKLILDNEQSSTPKTMTALFRDALNEIPTLKPLYNALCTASPSEVDKAFEHMLNKMREKYD